MTLAVIATAADPSLAARPTCRLPQSMAYREWVRAGQHLARLAQGVSWALGDWLVFGREHYTNRYRDALEVTLLDSQTLRNYAWVASRIPPSRRRRALSRQHHATVASLSEPEQDLWLSRAERLGWSRNRLRRELTTPEHSTMKRQPYPWCCGSP